MRLTKPCLLAALALGLLSGCGLEGLINLYGGDQYTQPVSTFRGSVALPDPVISVLGPSGEEVEPFEVTVAEGQYEVQLISASYTGLIVRAVQGQGIVEAFVPALAPEQTVEGVDLDLRSTAAVKYVEGLLGPSGKERAGLSDELLCIMGKKTDAAVSASGPAATTLQMMERMLGFADLQVNTQSRVFETPVITAEYEVANSVLNTDVLSRNRYDYDGDGIPNTNTLNFDSVFVQALQQMELSAPEDPDLIRVLFTVNFNPGQLDGTCGPINRFKWVREKPGKQMYFVGGIHETSPVQNTEIDAMLGNRGGWTPNQIRMYDDGTNGDRAAGDGIWSIYFDLPRGLRLGYKYTWGLQGELWNGTEEWPGNQRILEVFDSNGDGYVLRADDFGDESTNKDIANLNPRAGGSLEWNEDLNGDGYPEAREIPVDLAAPECGPDKFVTPDWVPALTISCEEFVAE